MSRKPALAVHKFSSCDGCQLSLLNLGENLPKVARLVDIVHFVEAGTQDEEAKVNIALVEGSISTLEEFSRIKIIRENSNILIAIGACAVAGGLQALRNMADADSWKNTIYANPEYINTLENAVPISAHTKVDYEIWGCPVNSPQILSALQSLLAGAVPKPEQEKVCSSCKRMGYACVEISQQQTCLGPVTNDGCDALCPKLGRACYGCFGPAATINTDSMIRHMKYRGLDNQSIKRHFQQINSQAPEFLSISDRLFKPRD